MWHANKLDNGLKLNSSKTKLVNQHIEYVSKLLLLIYLKFKIRNIYLGENF